MELQLNFDFKIEEFAEIEIDCEINSRICKPPKHYKPDNFVKSRNAVEFLKQIEIEKDCRIHAIIDGSFVFFDLIFELIKKNRIGIDKISISTLSLSAENIADMAVLLENKWIRELNLIVSDYFYSHERHLLVKNIYKELDYQNRFQFAVCSSHCKIITMKLQNGEKYVIHGSANLRSSGNIEQICIEQNNELYDFYNEMQNKTIEKYKTIEKSVIKGNLWRTING